MGWREPDEGIELLIRTNGVPPWILMPMVTPQMDWRPLVPARDMKDPRYFGNYIAVGYGNREVYLNTPAAGPICASTPAGPPRSAGDRA